MNSISSIQSLTAPVVKAQSVSRFHQHQRMRTTQVFVVSRLNGQHLITADIENIQLSIVSKPESEVPNINSDSQINL